MSATPAHSSIVESKIALRSLLKARRNRLPSSERAHKSAATCQRSLPLLQSATCVAVYSAIASELNPSELIAGLRRNGARIVFPRVTALAGIDFCEINDAAQLQPASFGLLEPSSAISPVNIGSIDAFVVPALAFDLLGNRLGWGKGHYDRTLAQNSHATRVGLCFQEQIEPSLPCEPTDQSMDWVITDSEIYQGPSRRQKPRAEDQS